MRAHGCSYKFHEYLNRASLIRTSTLKEVTHSGSNCVSSLRLALERQNVLLIHVPPDWAAVGQASAIVHTSRVCPWSRKEVFCRKIRLSQICLRAIVMQTPAKDSRPISEMHRQTATSKRVLWSHLNKCPYQLFLPTSIGANSAYIHHQVGIPIETI